MYTPTQLSNLYLKDLKRGLEVYTALRHNYADQNQLEKTVQFINTCQALLILWQTVAKRNASKC